MLAQIERVPALGGTAKPNGILVIAVEHKIKANDDREMPVLLKTSGQARYRCTKSKCSLKGVAQKSGQSRTAFTAQFNPKEVGIDSFVFHNITWTAAAVRDLDGQSAGKEDLDGQSTSNELPARRR